MIGNFVQCVRHAFWCAAMFSCLATLHLPSVAYAAPAANSMSDALIELTEIQSDALMLGINEQDVDKLETMARTLAAGPVKAATPEARLYGYYSELAKLDGNPNGLGLLGQWQLQYPKSPAPILVNAFIQIANAAPDSEPGLFFRSDKKSKDVSLPALEAARQFLLDNKSVAEKDPVWHILMAKIIVLGDRSEAELSALTDEALKQHPTNFEFVAMAANHYLPSHNGDGGKFEAWAQKITARFEPYDGSGVYARIYGRALTAYYGLNLLTMSHVEGPRLRKGIADLIERYPTEDNYNLSALFTCMLGDSSTTFQLIKAKNFGGQGYVYFDHEAFMLCKAWALQSVKIE